VSENMQQNPDGSWSPAEPLGWQGDAIDWEVYTPTEVEDRHVAHLYDKAEEVAVIASASRLMLHLRMVVAEARYRRRKARRG
jgi:hypothetical protein